MPVYAYRCKCGAAFDRFEAAHGSHEHAPCACGNKAQRVWTPIFAICDNKPAYFNHGLGKVVRTNHDIREARKRYAGETGSELIELGNEKSWRAKHKRIEYPRASEILA